MGDALIIYLLIGVAHWVTHILQCDECSHIFLKNTKFVLEGFINTFGWPIHFIQYVHSAFIKKQDTSSSMEELLKKFDTTVTNLQSNRAEFLEVRQHPGESDADFTARIKNDINDYVLKSYSTAKKGKTPNDQTH